MPGKTQKNGRTWKPEEDQEESLRIQKAMAMQGRHAFIVDFHNGNFYHKLDVVSCLSAVTLQPIVAARSSGAMTWSMPSKMDQTILPNPQQILELHY